MSDNPDCKILVVSSSTDQAIRFIQRVQALSNEDPLVVSSVESGSNIIPWTIVNKYYTANVHFETRVLRELCSQHVRGVPAVIYVWEHGEPFRTHVPELARMIQSCDPEVSLAVKLNNGGGNDNQDQSNLDDFLASHGFEFIDGVRGESRPIREQDDVSVLGDGTDVPGFPRILDALSTIMWPSLVHSQTTRRTRERGLLFWAREEEPDNGTSSMVSLTTDNSAGDSYMEDERKHDFRREMDTLEQWLKDEENMQDTEDIHAWISADVTSSQSLPTPTISLSATISSPTIGFDDDFTDFVSAPSSLSAQSLEVGHEAERLRPMHTGASYQSLASDAGESIDTWIGYTQLDNEDDADLPSSDEIKETARRMFGSISTQPQSATSLSPQITDNRSKASTSHEEDEDDMPPFDLTHMLAALQGMKEEIAGINDQDARRRAAARVALGLVYGLQREENFA